MKSENTTSSSPASGPDASEGQLDALKPDQLVAVVMRLAMEISVLRDRLTTHEQILAEKQLLSTDDIESYTPSSDDTAARQEARRKLIESIIDDLS